MKKVINRIQIGFLAYLVPLVVYLPIVWVISLIIQEHKSLLNALYAYLVIACFMILSLIANYIIAVLDFKRPWWLKFICTLVAGILFTPVYIILAPVGAAIIGIFPQSACYVTALLANVAMVTTGIFIAPRGNLKVMRIPKAVVVMNHRSSGDYFISPYIGGYRKWRVMIGANLWRYRRFHWFFNAIGIPIEREKDRSDRRAHAVRTSQELLNENKRMLLEVYPEGTRNRDDDSALLSFKPGAFKIACEAGVPIIPIVIVGMQKWRRPSKQVTETFKKENRQSFWLLSFKDQCRKIGAGISDFFIQVFTEGINPTVVKVYYLNPVETKGRTPTDVQIEVEHEMEIEYRLRAKLGVEGL